MKKSLRIKTFCIITILMVSLAAGSVTAFASDAVADPLENVATEQDPTVSEYLDEELLEETGDPALSPDLFEAEPAEDFSETEPAEDLSEAEPEDFSEAEPAEPEALPQQEEASLESEQESLLEPGIDDEIITLQEAPAAPVLTSVKSAKNGPQISWQEVKDAESYVVYRWVSSSKKWKKVGTAEGPSYVDTTATVGTGYYYTVSAVKGSEEGTYDENGIVASYFPGISSALVLKGRAARLSWEALEKADGYKIFRRVKGESSWSLVGQTEELSYADTAIEQKTEYEYVVRAFRNLKGKEYLGYISGACVASVDVPATPVVKKCASSQNGVRFTWGKVSGAKRYKVFRKTENGSWQRIAFTAENTIVDETAKAGTVYYYAVSAYFSADYEGLFDRDGVVGVYYPRMAITSIKNMSAVNIKWKAVSDAGGYLIYRKIPGKAWKKLKYVKSSVTSYTDKDVVSGKKYAYLIRAYKLVDGKRCLGAMSSDDRKLIYSLFTPKATAAGTADGKIKITWKEITGASSYEILRKNHKSGKFEHLANSKDNVYVDSDITAGVVQTYNVIAKKGEYVSNSSKNGVAAVYMAPPTLGTIKSTDEGLDFNWEPVKKAAGYKVLRKVPGGSWKSLGNTTSTSFTDKDVETDIQYSYVVKAYVRVGSKYYYGQADTSKALKSYYTPPLPYARQLAKSRLEEEGGTLKGAYDWAVKIPYSSAQPYSSDTDGYATWSFENIAGDCLGKAAVFCLMARELGYKADLIYGYVPMRAGGMGEHGWVEIEYEGTTYVCDPDFEYESGRNGYFINYGQSGTWMYQKDHVID